jgi:hypothetical protein
MVKNAAITNAKIDDAAITNAKIGNAAITNAKIGNAAVDTLQLAGESVTIPRSVFTAARIYDDTPVGYLDVAAITTTFPAGTQAAFMVSFSAHIGGDEDNLIKVEVFGGSSVIHTIWIPTNMTSYEEYSVVAGYDVEITEAGDTHVAFHFSDTVYAGTATYKVRCYWVGGFSASNRSLIILGLQR